MKDNNNTEAEERELNRMIEETREKHERTKERRKKVEAALEKLKKETKANGPWGQPDPHEGIRVLIYVVLVTTMLSVFVINHMNQFWHWW